MIENEDKYYVVLAYIESGNNPMAHSPTSSASGLYQFTIPTWTALGYDPKDIFDVDLQNEAIRKFTRANAEYLTRHGVEINFANLYAAHFLGVSQACNVLSKPDNTFIEDVVPPNVIKANAFLDDMRVSNFKGWLNRKTSITVA
jgi:hypothetical protein